MLTKKLKVKMSYFLPYALAMISLTCRDKRNILITKLAHIGAVDQ